MYTKMFNKMLDSSIWLEPMPTRIVWMTILMSTDSTGYAHFSAIENLAIRARASIEETEAAIQCFTSPDKNSMNPANEGRRVERVPGGFIVLNFGLYRGLKNEIQAREQNRNRQKKYRLKIQALRNAESDGKTVHLGSQKFSLVPVTDEKNKSSNLPMETVTRHVTANNADNDKQKQLAALAADGEIKERTATAVTHEPQQPKQPTPAELVYLAYPRRQAKIRALVAIKKALKIVPFERLLKMVQGYADYRKSLPRSDDQYIPLPASWFNAGQWDDELPKIVRADPGDGMGPMMPINPVPYYSEANGFVKVAGVWVRPKHADLLEENENNDQ